MYLFYEGVESGGMRKGVSFWHLYYTVGLTWSKLDWELLNNV